MARFRLSGIGRWLARLLRVGLGPGETRSPAEISQQAHAESHAQMKGWH